MKQQWYETKAMKFQTNGVVNSRQLNEKITIQIHKKTLYAVIIDTVNTLGTLRFGDPRKVRLYERVPTLMNSIQSNIVVGVRTAY